MSEFDGFAQLPIRLAVQLVGSDENSAVLIAGA